jgi:hypothetical protein
MSYRRSIINRKRSIRPSAANSLKYKCNTYNEEKECDERNTCKWSENKCYYKSDKQSIRKALYNSIGKTGRDTSVLIVEMLPVPDMYTQFGPVAIQEILSQVATIPYNDLYALIALVVANQDYELLDIIFSYIGKDERSYEDVLNMLIYDAMRDGRKDIIREVQDKHWAYGYI